MNHHRRAVSRSPRHNKAARIRAARKRAPRHPPGPEAQLRQGVARLFSAFTDHVIWSIGKHAAHYAKNRSDAADDIPGDLKKSSVFSSLWDAGHHLLYTSPFKRIVDAAAEATAKSAVDQTKKALNLDELDPDLDVTSMGEDGIERMSELMGDGLERSQGILDGWVDGLDGDPDEEDIAELSARVSDGLDGITGRALQWASLSIGIAFSEYIQASQKEAGVETATWLTSKDSHVRPEHRALDGVEFQWGDDPPLEAEDSDSGEACFPGEDYG